MDNIYLIMVVVLFALAISDLVVGVSNDAVNFLNSAIGSKAASFKVIMIVAAVGILVGATTSSGMMEVARKGIFNPNLFAFSDIMYIFLAVMLTDVLLLDLFNTFGMPTSTTVSIVFELLGAAIALAIIKVSNDPSTSLSEYINTAKALAIISGILLSVIVAFSVGAIVQYITRLIFSFNYQNRLKYIGAVWGGVAITAITYFILIKGAKGASFMTSDTKEWINNNALIIIGVSFVAWTVLLQIFRALFKLDILKFTVLVGTFALAMAFAGNDLVNFIGVPLAGLESYGFYKAAGNVDPTTFKMSALAGKVATDTYLLVIAGIIMVITLWTSKKAKAVVKTSLDLSRQQEGDERFGSSFFARSIVRSSINASNSINTIIPKPISNFIAKQFDSTKYEEQRIALGKDAPAFDMIRATVNLVVASILIAMATSYKLPLSTTYVTFMVAMGTSLTDGAWGRESAVYRVTGVLSVIGGWFFTAFSAFTVAFIIANIINLGGVFAIFALIVVAGYIMYRTHLISKKSTAKTTEVSEFEIEEIDGPIEADKILDTCKTTVTTSLNKILNIYVKTFKDFENEDRKELREKKKKVNNSNKKIKKVKDNIYQTVKKLQDNEIDSSLYYVQVIDYLRETAHAITFIVTPLYNHIDNNHSVFSEEQFKDLNELTESIKDLLKRAINIINNDDYEDLNDFTEAIQLKIEDLREMRKKQLKRIRKEKSGTKNSMLYLNILHETQNMILHVNNLVKSQRDLVNYKK
ncbi:inorganic phosphate transporter [Saccharicrinis aurantiacus]|uniref:inorganic phosphate transporter n=1 Tax=Saccharicrinis aurantiacus TaxID=1849719 RepID=UPI0024936553|nr:inorganic phosphate transporter [Saccharicrinis aurantiacus]